MTAPAIAEVPAGVDRPLWSVMIPTYNCAHFLGETLKSVLAQDPGPDQMQIEVVDDCSAADDPEAVVREIGCGRVFFFRKFANEGPIRNFNTCLERSKGLLIHILHGDDYVGSEFYVRFRLAFEESPDCAAIFSRAHVINEQGTPTAMTDFVSSLENRSNEPGPIMGSNPLRTPAAVVRRSFYEEYGGYDPTLVHTADWDMWVRAIRYGTARMLNAPLAHYRSYDQSHGSQLARTAGQLIDYLRLGENWKAAKVPGFDWNAFVIGIGYHATFWANHYRALGDDDAAAAYESLSEALTSFRWRARRRLWRLQRKLEAALTPIISGNAKQ